MSAYDGSFLAKAVSASTGTPVDPTPTAVEVDIIEPMFINGEILLVSDGAGGLDGLVSVAGTATSNTTEGGVGTVTIITKEIRDVPVVSTGTDIVAAGYQRIVADEYTIEGELILEGHLVIL